MSLIASLPMYDHPAARWATDRLWSAIAGRMSDEGVEPPSKLYRPDDYVAGWTEPNLLLSQTCGYPYVSMLRGKVQLVATPCYQAEGCDGPNYRSVLVARADDKATSLEEFRNRRLAFNAPYSQSGYNCLRAAIAPLSRGAPFFSDIVRSGRHVASMQAVAADEADLCAVDGVTFALEEQYSPDFVDQFKIIGWTESAPGLPYVTATGTSAQALAALRRALQSVAVDPDLQEVRDALLLNGFEVLSDEDYEPIVSMQQRAIELGYPELR